MCGKAHHLMAWFQQLHPKNVKLIPAVQNQWFFGVRAALPTSARLADWTCGCNVCTPWGHRCPGVFPWAWRNQRNHNTNWSFDVIYQLQCSHLSLWLHTAARSLDWWGCSQDLAAADDHQIKDRRNTVSAMSNKDQADRNLKYLKLTTRNGQRDG